MRDYAGFPALKCEDVVACRFSEWYPRFRKHSPKATVIRPLEDAFIDYLDSDGVFLPQGSGPMGLSELSDDEDDGNGSDGSQDLTWQLNFSALDARIRTVVGQYGGAVFPKLNWSSPQDAAWMLPGSTLKCQTPADVYLLLKSSDFISHDLDHAFDNCVDRNTVGLTGHDASREESREPSGTDSERGASDASDIIESDADTVTRTQSPKKTRRRYYDFELVLKKWFDMPRSQEWRCFVRDRELVAICQRDNNYYEFLQPEATQATVKELALDFFQKVVRPGFASASYTFDIYFTRSNDRIFLVDFNPYAPTTDSLLFTWEDIHRMAASSHGAGVDGIPELRVLTGSSIAGQSMPSYSFNRYPKDVVDLSSGASVAEFAEKWNNALKDGVLASDTESSTSSMRSVGR